MSLGCVRYTTETMLDDFPSRLSIISILAMIISRNRQTYCGMSAIIRHLDRYVNLHNGTLYIGPSEYFPKTHRGLTNTRVTSPTFLPPRLMCVAEQNSPLPDGAIPFPPFPTPGPATFQLAAFSNPSSLCQSRTYEKVMPMPSALNVILFPLASRTFTSKQRVPIPLFTGSNNIHTLTSKPLSHTPTSILKPKPKPKPKCTHLRQPRCPKAQYLSTLPNPI